MPDFEICGVRPKSAADFTTYKAWPTPWTWADAHCMLPKRDAHIRHEMFGLAAAGGARPIIATWIASVPRARPQTPRELPIVDRVAALLPPDGVQFERATAIVRMVQDDYEAANPSRTEPEHCRRTATGCDGPSDCSCICQDCTPETIADLLARIPQVWDRALAQGRQQRHEDLERALRVTSDQADRQATVIANARDALLTAGPKQARIDQALRFLLGAFGEVKG